MGSEFLALGITIDVFLEIIGPFSAVLWKADRKTD